MQQVTKRMIRPMGMMIIIISSWLWNRLKWGRSSPTSNSPTHFKGRTCSVTRACALQLVDVGIREVELWIFWAQISCPELYYRTMENERRTAAAFSGPTSTSVEEEFCSFPQELSRDRSLVDEHRGGHQALEDSNGERDCQSASLERESSIYADCHKFNRHSIS